MSRGIRTNSMVVAPLNCAKLSRPMAEIAAVLPLAGGRSLRPTKEGGGKRESSLRAVRAVRVSGAPQAAFVGTSSLVRFDGLHFHYGDGANTMRA